MDLKEFSTQTTRTKGSNELMMSESRKEIELDLHQFKSSEPQTLAKAIYEEFLVCKICLEAFKKPKCLECLHTFCEHCIEEHFSFESSYKKYGEFTCPLCRRRTQLPIGGCKRLPDNFLISNLLDMVGPQKPNKFPFCDFCKLVDNKFREANKKCMECGKMICSSCAAEHRETKVTSSHSVFDVSIEKDIGCREHPEENVRYYCETCETCVCVVCTFKEHRQHTVTQFSEAAAKYKEIMGELLCRCKTRIKSMDQRIVALTKCECIMSDTRTKIQQTANAFVDEIRREEKALQEELNHSYGNDCLQHLSKKSDLSIQVESLRHTSRLAETILEGKDIELLLLRKDIEDKLKTISDDPDDDDDDDDLPDTLSKQVVFLSGSLDFGRLAEKGDSEEVENTSRISRARFVPDDGSGWSFLTKREGYGAERSKTSEPGSGNRFVDKGVNTDRVLTNEKGINTKARSLGRKKK